jgi:glycolate oxidase
MIEAPGVSQALVAELTRVCGAGGVFHEPVDVLAYECDGLPHLRAQPAAVVLPSTAEQVQAVVRLCHREGIPFVARGHGTGLSGGALPIPGGVVIGLGRLNRVLAIDIPNRRVTVEPGVTNLEITRRVAPDGYYYAPDPSSQQVCSIGGNIAENSGGAHCLKYGFTVHHVLAVDFVLPDGELVHIGSGNAGAPGPDLLGLIIGSEGTLGVVTKAVVRILRRPESVQTLLAAFDGIDAAGEAVSEIIAAGIVPAAVEIMDALTIRAVEAAVHPGFPPADAVLIVELDGPAAEVQALFATVEEICRRAQATTIEVARDEAQRARIWKGRKAAFAAMGRVSPNYYVQDGVVPRTRLPEVLRRIRDLEARSGLRIGNVFHAGDGNLHPLICYDGGVPGESDRAAAVAGEILSYCVEAGGSITGEHGVGADKRDAMPVMFSEADLDMMRRVRAAFDRRGICNPGKLLPTPRLCGERPGPYRPHPAEEAGLADRV